jgi:hypothetical protein
MVDRQAPSEQVCDFPWTKDGSSHHLLWSQSPNSLNRSFHWSCGPLACGSEVRAFERAGKNCVILFVVYRHACVVARRISGPIANLPFHHPDGAYMIWTALCPSISLLEHSLLDECPLTVLPPRRAVYISPSPQTPSAVTNLPSLHPPSDIINGPPPRLRDRISTNNVNADNNANDLLHLHHNTHLHQRMETNNPVSLRLDLPLPRPAVHSLPRSVGSKMQFAGFPTRSFSGGQKTGDGAGVVVLCRSGGRSGRWR